MARKRFKEMNCAAAQALEQIGDWWTLLLVREAFYGTTTFSQFEEQLGIAKNVLTERLSVLVAHGIMARERPKPGVDRYAYRLTKKGEALMPVLVALMQWGDRWVLGEDKAPLRIVDRRDKAPIAHLSVTSASGHVLTIEDLRFRPGPGANEATLERFQKAAYTRLPPDD
ncbi:winged helix-turn-helix transcriptional regulator [Glycocaulis abyssi]|uniref:Winged helix-turn-helix transcriptional regulator n=1 Tax=Glycocaulis abyssi TaxID=1433403 RepID=A0ABV9NA88_9PROT